MIRAGVMAGEGHLEGDEQVFRDHVAGEKVAAMLSA
jgi:hypothetical protein